MARTADLIKLSVEYGRDRRDSQLIASSQRKRLIGLVLYPALSIGFVASSLESNNMKSLKVLRSDYEDYLRHQRGLSERTIYHLLAICRPLHHLPLQEASHSILRNYKAIDIAKFMEHVTSRKTPFRDKTPPTHLRNFFRYLFYAGHTAVNLAPMCRGSPIVERIRPCHDIFHRIKWRRCWRQSSETRPKGGAIMPWFFCSPAWACERRRR